MNLKYGQKQIPFEFASEPRLFQIMEPPQAIDPQLFKQRIKNHLQQLNPDLSNPAVIVGDKTRLCGYPEYLPVVLDTLQEFGAAREKLVVYIAYGTHLRQSEEESLSAYGPTYQQYRFLHHDCADTDSFVHLGETKRGTDVFVRKDLLSSSFVLTFGALSHHYFAGYGGGRKLIFPGLGIKSAIYQNHRLFLDKAKKMLSRGCQAGRINGNPLAEDLDEIERFKSADMAVHGILNSQGQVCDLLVGSGRDLFLKACARYGQYCEIHANQRYEFVLASCGGFPKDINFIQSHKAIHNAAAFVKDGGQMLVLAQCRDGVGSKTFLPWLQLGSYQAAFEKLAQDYEGNGGTALAMMEKLKRIRISVVTEIDDATALTIGFEKISIEQAQTRIQKASAPVAVIPNASLLVNTY